MSLRFSHIAIVGAGPIGMLLGLYLQKLGYVITIFEKRMQPSSLSQFILMSPDTLRIFKNFKFDDLLAEAVYFSGIDCYKHERAHYFLDLGALRLPCGYFAYLSQSLLENHLREKICEGDITLIRQHELCGMQYQGDKIYLQFISPDGESVVLKEYEVDYVFGCDGGHSTVRTLAGIGVRAEIYPGCCLFSDVTINWPFALTRPRYYLSTDGYAMLAPLPLGRTRVMLSIATHHLTNTPCAMPTIFMEALAKRMGASFSDFQLESCRAVQYGHRLAQQDYRDRVVLFGDALHQFSVVGGSNLNRGIVDVNYFVNQLTQCSPQKMSDLLKAYSYQRGLITQKQCDFTKRLTYFLARIPRNVKHRL